jgi:hypothetical protein
MFDIEQRKEGMMTSVFFGALKTMDDSICTNTCKSQKHVCAKTQDALHTSIHVLQFGILQCRRSS